MIFFPLHMSKGQQALTSNQGTSFVLGSSASHSNFRKTQSPFIVSGQCDLGSVSSKQKCEAMDIKAFGVSQLLDSPCYSSWTDQFYLENKGKYILEAWGHADPKTWTEEREQERLCPRERERRPRPSGSSFYIFFLPLGLPYAAWPSRVHCLLYLRSSLWSSDCPLTCLCSIFTGFSLPCLLATTTLDSCFLF